MAVYVVTWNLNREGANYANKRQALLARIGQYENARDPNLESVIFVSTPLAVGDVNANLTNGLDGNDRIVVSRMVANNYDGILLPEVWDWIRARV